MEYNDNRLADYSDDSSIGRGSVDVPFLLLVLLLLTIGVVMVLSEAVRQPGLCGDGNRRGRRSDPDPGS